MRLVSGLAPIFLLIVAGRGNRPRKPSFDSRCRAWQMPAVASMSSTRLITFMDGPLEGYVHQVKLGLPIPSTISRRDPKDKTRVYVYRVLGCDDKCPAYFDYSEHCDLPPRQRHS